MLQKLQSDQNRQEHTKKNAINTEQIAKLIPINEQARKHHTNTNSKKENNDRTVVTPTSSLVAQPPEN